jgi:rare lipoprotein A
MNICLLNHKDYPKTIYFVLLCLASIFFLPSFAQKKSTTKAKNSKSSNNRIIYGLASFYANKFEGRRTSSGEIFRQSRFTCACNMLPIGTWVKVTNVRNGRSVIVKVNDRLHPKMRRVADLSKAAAHNLGYLSWGVTRVKVEVIGKVKPS